MFYHSARCTPCMHTASHVQLCSIVHNRISVLNSEPLARQSISPRLSIISSKTKSARLLNIRYNTTWWWHVSNVLKSTEAVHLTRDLQSFKIRFDSNDSLQKWRADSKFSNLPHPPSYRKPRSLFNKKLQPLYRCNWDLFYVYDFMFM